MKKQTYIARVYNSRGEYVTFERFALKTVAGVKNAMLKLCDVPLYRACNRDALTVAVHRTPDGYHAEKNPVETFAIPEYK